MSKNVITTALLSTILVSTVTGTIYAVPFTGPISPYYLDKYDSGIMYVVQGKSVINSFPLTYNHNRVGTYEGVFAISNGHVNTNWMGNTVLNMSPDIAGQYT